ncbi:hypothetical protein ASG88_05300 [Nocardioides sp. Soil777]|uniref:hypothetical protein n=1 Tax=Nocardioides sp. Soil777 TaxID=1736409 RepID=UPI000702969F|nr:hypothetical protein [Nocardioides sp. Soil777]KRF02777.1 hypothetical protein ASG88_05300 [Nocardioides sp. Soil777]
MVIGLLVVVAFTAVVGLVVGAAWDAGSLGRYARRPRRRPPQPTGRPLERVVADLHRIRAEVLAPVPGASKVRRDATLAAYDDVLADACRALGVPDHLTAVPPGTEREAERLHTEWLLEQAGVPVTSPR